MQKNKYGRQLIAANPQIVDPSLICVSFKTWFKKLIDNV